MDPEKVPIRYLDHDRDGSYKHQKIQIFNDLLLSEPQNTLLEPLRSELPTVTSIRVKSVMTGALNSYIEMTDNFQSGKVDEDTILWQLNHRAHDLRESLLKENIESEEEEDDDETNRIHERKEGKEHKKQKKEKKALRKQARKQKRKQIKHMLKKQNDDDREVLSDHNNGSMKIVFAGDYIWTDMFGQHFNRSFPQSSFNVADLDNHDRKTKKDIIDQLSQPDQDFKLFVAHIIGVDHAGHTFNVNHPEVERKLNETEVFLR